MFPALVTATLTMISGREWMDVALLSVVMFVQQQLTADSKMSSHHSVSASV